MDNSSAWCNITSWPEQLAPGNCTDILASGTGCIPLCIDGYSLTDHIFCEAGTVRMARCEPMSCNASILPENSLQSNCPQTLHSDASCAPVCAQNFILANETYCYLGKLTLGVCVPNRTESTLVDGGIDTDGGMATSTPSFTSSSTMAPKVCTEGAVLSSIGICKCNDTTVEEENQDGTLRCRSYRSCRIDNWLQKEHNSSGPQALHKGSCENRTVLVHGGKCKMMCKENTAPSLASPSDGLSSDILKAVSTDVECNDGVVEGPPQGTWCSQDAWEIPAVIFLAGVTVASLVAGGLLELRHYHFDRNYAQALAIRMPPAMCPSMLSSRPHSQ